MLMKMRRAASLLLLSFLTVCLQAQTNKLRGTWTANLSDAKPWMQMSFQDGNGQYSHSFDSDTAASQLAGKQGPVQFTITRDAGTFVFDGTVKGDLASGFVDFTANPQYVSDMAALGYPNLTDRQLFRMAMVDVKKQFVADLNSAGYAKLGADQLIRMSMHDVNAAYIQAMASAGYKNLKPEDLIRTRIHDLTPEFVKEMAASGYSDLSGEQLVRLKIHGVDPGFVKAVKQAGLTNVDADELVRMKIHDVTPESIAKVKQLGYSDVTAEQMVRLSIHDVTPEYIAQAKSAQQDISLEEIVRMKIQGGRRARM